MGNEFGLGTSRRRGKTYDSYGAPLGGDLKKGFAVGGKKNKTMGGGGRFQEIEKNKNWPRGGTSFPICRGGGRGAGAPMHNGIYGFRAGGRGRGG